MSQHGPSPSPGPHVPKELDAKLLFEVQAFRFCVSYNLTPSDGEKQAQEQFVAIYDPRVRCFVASCGMKGEDAEECYQESWIKILENIHEFSSDGTEAGLCSWMHAIVRHAAANLRRYRKRHPTVPMEGNAMESLICQDGDPAADFERHCDEERVHQVLALLPRRLPEITYLAFYKHWIEQKKVKDIAAELNVSAEKISKGLWKAMRLYIKLYERMGSGGGVEISRRS
jgi:RNA polymerase sigma factor (sigma-70 family)